MRIRIALLTITAALALSACGQGPASTPPTAPDSGSSAAGIQVTEIWSRPAIAMDDAQPTGAMPMPTKAMGMDAATPASGGMGGMNGMGATGAVYMTIKNSGGAPDKLIKAQSDVAKTVELHTVINDNGVMSMRPVEGIDIPAGESVTLKPGGFHVMLIGLNRDLKIGDSFQVTLQFEKGGQQVVQSTVRQP